MSIIYDLVRGRMDMKTSTVSQDSQAITTCNAMKLLSMPCQNVMSHDAKPTEFAPPVGQSNIRDDCNSLAESRT